MISILQRNCAAAALVSVVLAADPSIAFAAEAPVPNKGDTTWMLVASALVLMMSLPGLALFYGGLVRAKNMLSVLSQVFMIVAVAALIWVAYGYSLAFTNGGGLNAFVGGFSKAFLLGVTPESNAATFSNGVVIPEFAYIMFQATFACITPALIVGAFAERIKFSALMLFTVLWLTLIYFPMAHMVWYWAGPDAVAEAAKAVAAATDEAARAAARARLEEVKADAGLLFQWGALDFAGGTVVHINAGVAGLVGSLFIGKRIGYPHEMMAPHSLTMTMIGASLLWIGWFGFNAGSNLEANGTAALAFINTFVAPATAALAWLFVEWGAKGKPSFLGLASGAVAGLVAITPAAGWVGPLGAIAIGTVSGILCFYFVAYVRARFGYDDSLDVFGIHGVGGIVGAIGAGVFVSQSLGGVGIPDYETRPGELVVGTYEMGVQVLAQIKSVAFTVVWSGVGSAILFKAIDLIVGLRVTPDQEREGLDLAEHGERAYTM